MRLLLLFVLLLASTPDALAARPWVRVDIDHGNRLYHAGERAAFRLWVENYPTTPSYALTLTAQEIGVDADPVALEPHENMASWQTAPLAAGAKSVHFVAKLVGPVGEPEYGEVVVHDQTVELEVVE